MLKELAIGQLKEIGRRFKKTVSVFDEEDAGFKPQEDVFGVAYVIAHSGESILWLIAGGFSPDGFDMNFEEHHKRMAGKDTLGKALAHFDKCVDDAVALVESHSEEELLEKLPEGPVMGGLPRYALVEAVSDHTASHRGTLGVYARLLDKKPPMPYEP